MQEEIPLFPLNIVVYPGELVNLHIFEPRYKDLVNDCLKLNRGFGIPTYNSTTLQYGTTVEILEVAKTYKDGRMDIRTRGRRVFEVSEFYNPWGKYKYSGGLVKYIPNSMQAEFDTRERITYLVKKLFSWLSLKEKFVLNEEYLAYSIAHKVGFKLEEEFELLQIFDENARQKYIIQHLETLLPALERAEEAKERILMNGHFRHLVPPNF